MKVIEAKSSEAIGQVKALFQAYAAALPIDLGFQSFDEEMENFPEKYELLLLALHEGKPVGAVALLRHTDERCEMKRLFVQPEARNLKAGQLLCEALIAAATARGYREMVLDTLQRFAPATALYIKLGFHEISAYYDNPIEDVLFMAKEL